MLSSNWNGSAVKDLPTQRSPRLAVHAEGLTRQYGDRTAVDALDLSIPEGEIYGFLGPNGAGKSTAVKMLCTLLRPTRGRAVVAGHDVEHDPQSTRRRIGVALQDVALDEGQTGRELLTLQARLYGLRGGQVRRRVDEVLGLVDIGTAIDRRVGTYSGGMKRRLDLALALVHGPAVLFLDEPTTGLDPESRRAVWSEIRHLNTEVGMTIFLTTQYLEEADALADRAGVLRSGTLVAEGTPAQLKRTIGHDQIVVEVEGYDPAALDRLDELKLVTAVQTQGERLIVSTVDGGRTIAPVAQVLGASTMTVRCMTVTSPSLDDVVIALTASDHHALPSDGRDS
jgi:ABC-2 type transport system ATP-binding protein